MQLDFGDLTNAQTRFGGLLNSPVRGIIGGGEGSPANRNTLDYITIASTGNAVDFGDLIISKKLHSGCSNQPEEFLLEGSGPSKCWYELCDDCNYRRCKRFW